MAAVRSRNTNPEVVLRRALHLLGLRYRLNVRSLAGSPDLVFPRHGVVVFIHGCFWHGHDCRLFVMPKTRPEFWLTKIVANQERDRRNHTALRADGWRVGTVWECAMRGRASPGVQKTAAGVSAFIRDSDREEVHFRESGGHQGAGLPKQLQPKTDAEQ